MRNTDYSLEERVQVVRKITKETFGAMRDYLSRFSSRDVERISNSLRVADTTEEGVLFLAGMIEKLTPHVYFEEGVSLTAQETKDTTLHLCYILERLLHSTTQVILSSLGDAGGDEKEERE